MMFSQTARELQCTKAPGIENRTALVIENGKYADSPLRNPPNDAADMAAALKSLVLPCRVSGYIGGKDFKQSSGGGGGS